MPAALMAEASFAAQDPEHFKFPSRNPLRHRDSSHTSGSTDLELCTSLQRSTCLLSWMTILHQIWDQHLQHIAQYLKTGKCHFLFLSPELSQASPLLSAALKGTSSPSCSGRKVEEGKTGAKKLSIALHRGRFKAWLGLP